MDATEAMTATMQFCHCHNPRIARGEKSSDVVCELCGFPWDKSKGSQMPAGRRVHRLPGANAPLIRAPQMPMTFEHEPIHTEGEPGPEMSRERAQSVAEELCDFKAEKIVCRTKRELCIIEITFNACNRQTFTGATWFLALRGVMRMKNEKARMAAAAEVARAKRRPLWRKIIDFFRR